MLNFDYFYNQLPTHGSLDRLVEASLELAIECITQNLEPTDTSDAPVYGFEGSGLLRKAHAYFKKELTHSVIEGVVFAALANQVGYKAARGSVVSVAGHRFFDNLELALGWIDKHTDNSVSATAGLILQAPLARRALPTGTRYGSPFVVGLSLVDCACRKLFRGNNAIGVGSRLSCSIIEPAKALSARSFVSLICWTVIKADPSSGCHLAIAIPARFLLILLVRVLRLVCTPSVPFLVFRPRVARISAATDAPAVVNIDNLLEDGLDGALETSAITASDAVLAQAELDEDAVELSDLDIACHAKAPLFNQVNVASEAFTFFNEELVIDEMEGATPSKQAEEATDVISAEAEVADLQLTEVEPKLDENVVVAAKQDAEDGSCMSVLFVNDSENLAQDGGLDAALDQLAITSDALLEQDELAAELIQLPDADTTCYVDLPSFDQAVLMAKAITFFKEESESVNAETEAVTYDKHVDEASPDLETYCDVTHEMDLEDMSALFVTESDGDLIGNEFRWSSDSQLDYHHSGSSSSDDATEADTSFSDSSVCETAVHSTESDDGHKFFDDKHFAEFTISEGTVSLNSESQPPSTISDINAVDEPIEENAATESINGIEQGETNIDDVLECKAPAQVKRRSFFPQTETTVMPALIELARNFPPIRKPAKSLLERPEEREVQLDPFNYKFSLPSITDYQDSSRSNVHSQPNSPHAHGTSRFGGSSLASVLPASYPRERPSSEEVVRAIILYSSFFEDQTSHDQTLDWIVTSRFGKNPFKRIPESPETSCDKPLLDKFGYPIVSESELSELDTSRNTEVDNTTEISDIEAASLQTLQPYHGTPPITLQLSSPLLTPAAPLSIPEDDLHDYSWPLAHPQPEHGWQSSGSQENYQPPPSPTQIAPQPRSSHDTYQPEEPVADFEAIGEPDVWEPTRMSRRRVSRPTKRRRN